MLLRLLNAVRLTSGAKASIEDKALARLQALHLVNTGRTHDFDERTGAIEIDDFLILPCDFAAYRDWSKLLEKSRELDLDWDMLEVWPPSQRPKFYSWRSPRISSLTFNMYYVVGSVEIDLGAVTA